MSSTAFRGIKGLNILKTDYMQLGNKPCCWLPSITILRVVAIQKKALRNIKVQQQGY